MRLLLLLLLLVVAGCRAKPCASASECPLGTHCAIDPADREAGGFCKSDCVTNEDCGDDPTGLRFSICDNEGRCNTETRPPRLKLLEPENDSLLGEGTRKIRLVGEVETAAETVIIDVAPLARDHCVVGFAERVTVRNPEVGRQAVLPFIVNDFELDPGLSTISVRARVGTVFKQLNHLVEIPCAGCAEIRVEEPAVSSSVPGLVLPRLRGRIEPSTVRSAIWRVRSEAGDVFDGPISVESGGFLVDGIPLFPGFNRVEVQVSGVGAGLGENRCSIGVTSGVPRERGLRALLSWDGPTSDLDVHLIAPGGRYGDPATDLTPRFVARFGSVADDFDGFGPEVARVEELADGVYGLIVEPVFDARDPGANAFVRILVDGRPIARGVLGPQHLTDFSGELWVVGTMRVAGGRATWTYLNDRVDGFRPPTRPPADWPMYE